MSAQETKAGTDRKIELPWSKTTGQISYFRILLDEKEVGRAGCVEFVLQHGEIGEEKDVGVVVEGILFSGEVLRSKTQRLRIGVADPILREWVEVR